MQKIILVPNNNWVTVVGDDDHKVTINVDLSDLAQEGVRVAAYDRTSGMVDVEYRQPANETMTLDEFQEYFGEVTKRGRRRRRHFDEVRPVAEKALLPSEEADRDGT